MKKSKIYLIFFYQKSCNYKNFYFIKSYFKLNINEYYKDEFFNCKKIKIRILTSTI